MAPTRHLISQYGVQDWLECVISLVAVRKEGLVSACTSRRPCDRGKRIKLYILAKFARLVYLRVSKVMKYLVLDEGLEIDATLHWTQGESYYVRNLNEISNFQIDEEHEVYAVLDDKVRFLHALIMADFGYFRKLLLS